MLKCLGREEDDLPQEHTAQHFKYHFTASVRNLNLNSKTKITKLFPQVAEDQIFFFDTNATEKIETDSLNSEEVWDINNEQNEEQSPSSGPVTRSRSRRVRTRPYPSTHQPTAPGSPGESFSENFDSAGSRVPQIQSLQNCSTQIWIISSDET